VAGNLPYNVATPILFRLLGAAGDGVRLSDATVMLQKEVADRVVAGDLDPYRAADALLGTALPTESR